MSRPQGSDIVWQRHPDVAHVDSGDRVALLDLRHPERPAFILDGTAALVWRGVDGRATTGEIVGSLAAEYGTSEEQVAHDVSPFLADLHERELIVTTRPVDMVEETK